MSLSSLLSWESASVAQQELEQLYSLLINLRVPWLSSALSSRKDAAAEERSNGCKRTNSSKRLKDTLKAAACVDGVSVWRSRLLGTASVVQLGGLVSALSCLSLSPEVRGGGGGCGAAGRGGGSRGCGCL
jgi:hypothetical protein